MLCKLVFENNPEKVISAVRAAWAEISMTVKAHLSYKKTEKTAKTSAEGHW